MGRLIFLSFFPSFFTSLFPSFFSLPFLLPSFFLCVCVVVCFFFLSFLSPKTQTATETQTPTPAASRPYQEREPKISLWIPLLFILLIHRLVGPVVKASASRAVDPGFDLRLDRWGEGGRGVPDRAIPVT